MPEFPKSAVQPVAIASDTSVPAQPQPLVKKMDSAKKGSPMKTIVMLLVIIFVGIASGYGLNTVSGSSAGLKSAAEVTSAGLKVGDTIGSDEKNFPNKPAEGVLVRGGIEGEGSHHLLREGGPTQNVYLTSSIVDLGIFEDHKIQVWGETFAAQTAGWLMDVGRIKVLELNAPKPFSEEEPNAPQKEE